MVSKGLVSQRYSGRTLLVTVEVDTVGAGTTEAEGMGEDREVMVEVEVAAVEPWVICALG